MNILSFSAFALDSNSHVHGLATASIVQDASKISLEMTVPAESIVGFEHFRLNKEEKEKVDSAIQKMTQMQAFIFLAKKPFIGKQKAIKLNLLDKKVEWQSNLAGKKDKKEEGHEHHHPKDTHHNSHEDHQDHSDHQDHGAHASFKLYILYEKTDLESIHVIQTAFFEAFPQLESIQLQYVAEDIQHQYMFTPSNQSVKTQ